MREKVVVVDEHDVVIGLKWRDELVTGHDRFRVALLWIVNSQGQVLLSQRAWTRRRQPGKRGAAVAGMVTEGESYHSTIIREAQEELNLYLRDVMEGPHYAVESGDGGQCYRVQWFVTCVDQNSADFVRDEKEIAGVKWYDPHELRTSIQIQPELFTENIGDYVPLMIDKEFFCDRIY